MSVAAHDMPRIVPAAAVLLTAPLTEIRAIDFRAPERSFWNDEAALWARLRSSWAGLDDAAWALPGAAPSDAGGSDWSLQDHVGHIADWFEIAAGYVDRVLRGGRWPTDEDYDGGDFDRYNEGRRDAWARMAATEVVDRLEAGRLALRDRAGRLSPATIRGDDAWGWVFSVMHGHALDHLAVIEPWTDRLRRRQAEGDPFLGDPRPAGDGSVDAIDRFWATEATVFRRFDELVRAVPPAHWEQPGPTPGWTLTDHVAHLAHWFEECADAVDAHLLHGGWPDGPTEGIDAWNARRLAEDAELDPVEAGRRFDRGRRRLEAAVRRMEPSDLASPEAGEWVYECLHGHVRAHLAMVGPWCARADWPTRHEGVATGGEPR